MRWRTRFRYHRCFPYVTNAPNCENSPFVNSLALSGPRLYVGGAFTSVGGRQRPYVAALDATTSAVRGWRPAADEVVSALTVAGSTVFAGGEFGMMGPVPRGGFAMFRSIGASASAGR